MKKILSLIMTMLIMLGTTGCEQEKKAARTPAYRIAFRKDWNAAAEDQKNIRRWVHGEISMIALCRLVAKTNYLNKVTAAQMEYELKNTGWLK